MKSTLTILLGFLFIGMAAQDSLIISALQENTHLVSFENGALTGLGAEIIDKELSKNQFVLVGEMHGIKEVGEFCEGLFNAGKKHGFKYFALENDPWMTANLESMANSSESSLIDFSKNLPFSIPFYDNASDFSFLQSIVKDNPTTEPRMWGLDQVFMTSARFLFDEISQLATSTAGKELAKSHLKKAQEGFVEAMKNQNPSAVYLSQITQGDFAEMENTFQAEKNEEVLKRIDGLKQSQKIYNYWFEGRYYQNNRARSIWMKSHFMDYYHQAKKIDNSSPKVMFKFGSNHAVRGLTSVHIYDLGNMVSELAETEGNQSLHIQFVAVKGNSYNMLMGAQPFDNTTDMDARILEAIKPFLNGKEWILIDMRPLRNLRLKKESESFKRNVFGFDFLVYVPEADAQEPFPK